MEILKQGSFGPQVALLQATLKRIGYYTAALDGIFGPITKAAVTKFQNDWDLAPDGIVGPATWRALHPYITGYVKHKIKSGDTIYKLANTYQTSQQAIETANPSLVGKYLVPGANIIIPFSFPVVFTNIPFTHTVLTFCIEGLKARYPFIQTKIIGKSINGKNISSLAIGIGTNKVMYNASHHANEWITSPLLIKFLEQYAKSYATNTNLAGYKTKELYNTSTIYLVPMVNPDGVDLVTGEIKPGSQSYTYAKGINTPDINFPSGWKANIRGVDLNLNYPAGWENAKKIKYAEGYTKPGPRDYVGPYPLSEPESQAMANFTKENTFKLTISYHTQGEVIYWKYLNYQPSHSYEIAQKFAMASGYAVEETPIYSGYAGYKDWFIQTYNRPGYTIEVGLGQSPLPLSQFNKIYDDNLAILLIGAQPF